MLVEGSEGTDRRNLIGLWSRHSKKVIGRSSQSCIFSSSGAETKVASMYEDPLRLTKVGSCPGGLMQESSFCRRKPSKISEYLESVGPHRVLLQFRSPPIMVLDRCSEEKLPSILVRSWEGSLPGGLYIEIIKKEDPQKEMTAAAMSSVMSW